MRCNVRSAWFLSRRRMFQMPSRDGGFTLIELLVVIAIISVLVTIIIPAMAKVRQMAKDVLCTTNLRAVGLGWHLYLYDNDDTFPLWRGNTHWFYGGKHPAIINERDSGALPYRPLNPYVSRAIKNEDAAELFECPSDRRIPGITKWRGKSYSTYDFYGNSYMMNWLLLQPVNPETGFYKRGVFLLRDVEVPFNHLALAGDCQWYYTVNRARWDAHFHNREDRMNILFLDGRAEFLQLVRGEGVSGRYTFWPYRPRVGSE